MNRKLVLTGVLAVVAGGLSAGIAIGAGGEDESLTGTALDRATAAALAHTGGGTVVETEVGDDGAAYGIEVRLEDGTVVEVALDADFEVVGQTADDDGDGEDGDVDD